MGNIIYDFKMYLEVEKNVSGHTQVAYVADVKKFAKFLVDNNFIKQQNEIIGAEPEIIRQYLSDLYRQKVKKVTVNRKVSSLRAFYKYVLRTGKISRNPAEMILSLKTEKYVPNFLSVDEILELLKSQNDNSTLALRNRAILEIFYSCGLRLSELAGLNVMDFDFDQKLIKVRGKGKK
jgi:integrase/recombinase XerC